MYLGPMLLSRDSPLNAESNEPKNMPNGVAGGRSNGSSGRNIWKRKEVGAFTSQESTPSAQVGEQQPPKPAARLTDSTKISSSSITTPKTAHTMDTASGDDAPQQPDPRKVVIKIPAELLADLRSQCDKKASVSLLGRIQGKHPGLKALTAWAQETLHPSLALLSLKTNNVFEVTFDHPEGRIHALNQADLACESATIFFSSWRPHFDANIPQESDRLDHPIWMQVVNLCQVLREETFLHTLGEQIGQVLSIDNSEAYRAKLFGPRIRLLVRDLDNLPHTIILPRLDGEGTVEYAVEFSGLPNQCGRCRSRDHQVRYCPRKEVTSRCKLAQRFHNRIQEPTHQPPTTLEPTPTIQHTTDPTQSPPGTSDTPNAHQVQENKEGEDPPALAPIPQNLSHTPQEETPIPDIHETSAEMTDLTTGLQPDELNFPKLPSPSRKAESWVTPKEKQQESPKTPTPTHFVWRSKPPTEEPIQEQTQDGDKGKGKQASRNTDSAPMTRQGYRSGRLADDFWTALNTPHTPTSQRKSLRVIPVLIRDKKGESMEYLVNSKAAAPKFIAQVHIAELLAGIPWTEMRVRQHVVNEVAQALYKILVFPNPAANPLQKWRQGKWFANWGGDTEGDQVCTLYVSVLTQENKFKPRKGHAYSWIRVPEIIREQIQSHPSDDIEAITEDRTHWHNLTFTSEATSNRPSPTVGSAHHNRFAALGEDESLTT